ncbi:pyridoxal phosphate-dependent transferase [Fimicolochytrium jonesii]|uniref:pyridoxal phosphate-dependent transferase n=1 Tax=Fimicolochytrium jonesii TaxID=1396493 RepID=UPI0022FF039A|nr:pyridoxal phosphate-dependent transferase [Fimicolochytrium jonesii]KAI8827180.1 pyridoxal phosphate-dependent transferase [Fimicolochytrium jonesii]
MPPSALAEEAARLQSIVLDLLRLLLKNPYHPTENPQGIVNLGTAENHLMFPEMLEKLNSPGIRKVTADDLKYGSKTGSHRLRTEIASFFNRHLRPVIPLDADHLTVHAGCTAVLCNIAQVLLNPGDGIMIPSPYYGGFDFDVTTYAQGRIVPVPTTSAEGFDVRVDHLEKAYTRAVAEGIQVKVLLLTNPGNPQAKVYSADEMMSFLTWAATKDLEVIVDEIYALSVFGGTDPDDKSTNGTSAKPFTSVHALPHLPSPTHTHTVWSFSKDFGANGLRCGVFASRNERVLRGMSDFAFFTNVSSLVDSSLANLLGDEEWVDGYVVENQRRMRRAYERVAEVLTENGVDFVPAQAGFFVFANLKTYAMAYHTKTNAPASMPLWRPLTELLLANGLYILPGEAFQCAEPGWFRIIFTVSPELLDLGLQRLFAVLGDVSGKRGVGQGTTVRQQVAADDGAADNEDALAAKALLLSVSD